MATTERGIYYTDGGNDGDLADLNVITKAMADSTEAALDVLAETVPAATKAYVDAAQNYCTGTQSGQTITPNLDTNIGWNAEIDPGGILDGSTGIVTIPTKGLYTVAGGLGWGSDTASDVFRRLRVLVNNSPIAEQSNVTSSGSLSVTWVGVLDAGAQVKFDCFHQNTGNLTGSGWMAVAFNGTVA